MARGNLVASNSRMLYAVSISVSSLAQIKMCTKSLKICLTNSEKMSTSTYDSSQSTPLLIENIKGLNI